MEKETGWIKKDILELFDKVGKAKETGKSLNGVFCEMGEKLGHKPNSIRNFYYNFLSLLNNSPSLRKEYGIDPDGYKKVQFELFKQEEINDLVKNILIEYKNGKSVRKTIQEMANGDRQKMLRYQNKYRSMILNHKDRVEKIMDKLKTEGISFYNPYEEIKGKGFKMAMQGDVFSNMYRVMNQLSMETDINLNLAFNLTRQMIEIILNKMMEKINKDNYRQLSFEDIEDYQRSVIS